MSSVSVPFYVNFFEFDNHVDINKKTDYQNCINDDQDSTIICQNCETSITANQYKINRDRRHKHTFNNPLGEHYTIGCFSYAQNTLSIGKPTEEWTWFTGYTWTICVCANCDSHLGWYFDKSQEQSFFGFILDQLKS